MEVDGQVDAYQVVNKFVAVSIFTNNGMLQNKYILSEEPCGRGTDGMLEAVKNDFDNQEWNWSRARKKLCGVTTDRENANTAWWIVGKITRN